MPKSHPTSTSILCVFAFSATCFAQPASFRTVTATERPSNSTNPIVVDVNNDGIPDLIQQTYRSNGSAVEYTVRLGTGSGTFGAPATFTLSFPNARAAVLTVGDFNGDGKADLITNPPNTNQLVLLLGKGDGFFQAAKTIALALPPGQQLDFALTAADFNGDGKLDLIVNSVTLNAPSGSRAGGLYLIPGSGDGNFGTPSLIYSLPQYDVADNLLAGDFDGDGNPDVAYLDAYICDKGMACSTTLHVLYNDGDGASHFTDIPTDVATVYDNGFLLLSSGDLNSDGRSDLIATVSRSDPNTPNQVYVLYGQTDRAFHLYTITAPNVADLAMADFNGDGRMDLVGTGADDDLASILVFFLAGSDEGTFTQQTYALPNYPVLTSPVVGDFNSDTKPDVLLVLEKTTTTSILTDVLNTTTGGNWGGCAWPKTAQGIHVCAPQATIPPTQQFVRFNASASSFGDIRKIELWVDGTKIAEQNHTWGHQAWFDFSDPFPAGPHRGVIIASDIDNHLQKSAFTFTVGQFCSPPASAGVTICAPANGSTVSSPVTLHAGAKVNGTLDHLQVWLDGKWYANIFESTTVDENISLPAGMHRIAVLALNTTGQKWESAVNVTVK